MYMYMQFLHVCVQSEQMSTIILYMLQEVWFGNQLAVFASVIEAVHGQEVTITNTTNSNMNYIGSILLHSWLHVHNYCY